MTFLKTVLIILLVYYASKIILQFAKPYIMRYIAKKANEKFGQAFNQGGFNTNTTNTTTEGEITLDKSNAKKSSSKKTVGEYVDFEEVD